MAIPSAQTAERTVSARKRHRAVPSVMNTATRIAAASPPSQGVSHGREYFAERKSAAPTPPRSEWLTAPTA